jgi:iron complex transport system ATP-binding protein
VASHDINLLAKYCDKVIILSKGEIVAFGDPKEVITEDLIRDVYGVEADVLRNNGCIFVVPNNTVKSLN